MDADTPVAAETALAASAVEAGHPAYVWLSGALKPWSAAHVHVTAMGASAHTSVFEGIKAYRNPDTGRVAVFRLREHLRRLLDSMRMMRMPLSISQDEWEAATLELLRANGAAADTYIRPVAYYSGTEHVSFADTLGDPPALLIWTRSFASQLDTPALRHVGVTSWARIADNVMPARIKSMSNYQNNRLAALEARVNGYDDALLLTASGKVSETPGAAIFLVRDGVVSTPSVTNGILESITRSTVIELLQHRLGLPVEQRDVDRTELYVADEAFFCGTAAEIKAVASVDRIAVGTGCEGRITSEIRRLYRDIVRGTESAYAEWRTVV